MTQTVVTTVDGVEVTVVNTHVTTGDNDHQPEQLEEAFDRAGEPSGPVIFAGDFNARASTTDPLAREQDLTRLTERLGERCDGSGRNAIDQVYGSEGVTGGQRPGFKCGPSTTPTRWSTWRSPGTSRRSARGLDVLGPADHPFRVSLRLGRPQPPYSSTANDEDPSLGRSLKLE